MIACANLFGQAAPVVGATDPTSLFKDKDKTLNKNKQAAMHIVIDLLEAGHWSEADKWLTERYIQHNPLFGSGREPIMKAFGGRGPGGPIPASPKEWKTKIVAVLAEPPGPRSHSIGIASSAFFARHQESAMIATPPL